MSKLLSNLPKILPFAITLLLAGQLFAQAPKFSNDFLNIGVSARAQGMATAHIALVDDVTAGYWNPAGLTGLKNFQAAAMHAEWFAGIGKYDYGGLGWKLGKNAGGSLSFVRLGIDNIPNTFNLIDSEGRVNYDNVTEFSASDVAFFISYARKFGDKLSGGLSTKIITRSAGTFARARGFGVDLGIQYKASENWTFALMGRDITTTFNAWKFSFTEEEKAILDLTNNVIPVSSVEVTRPRVILGLAHHNIPNDVFRFTFTLDADFTFDGQRNVLISSSSVNIDPKAGLELAYKDFIFIRGGIGNFQQAQDDLNPETTIYTMQPNVGLGISLGNLKVDYALTNLGNVSQVLYSHIFSLKLDLVKRKKKDPWDD